MNRLNQRRISAPIVMIVVMGFVAISMLHLLLTIFQSQSVYELSDLKREIRELETTSQILEEEVASLASHQNLLNAAGKLGMVPNTNPVFLRLSDKEVLGKPKPAVYLSGQSRNLVANSAMIKVKTSNKKASVASSGEPKQIERETPILSAIPASPTR